ncbi:c-type cytochrome [Vibrio sp. E150_011]
MTILKGLNTREVTKNVVLSWTRVLIGGALMLSSTTTLANAVEQRQQAFSDIESNTKSVSRLLDQDHIAWDEVQLMSEKLQLDSNIVSTAFVNEAQKGGKAKSDIWESPEKFDRLMLEMTDSYASLKEAVRDQNEKQAKQAIKSAESTCRSCHRSYRSRW